MYLKVLLVFIPILKYCNCDINDTTNNLANNFRNLIDLNALSKYIMSGLEGHSDAEYITIQMLDASTKIPYGIFHGSSIDMGDFDECYNIHKGDVYGKYCVGFFKFDDLMELESKNLNLNITRKFTKGLEEFKSWYKLLTKESIHPFRLAVCIPEKMKSVYIPSDEVYFSENRCYSRNKAPTITQAAIMTLAILGVFFTLVILSTTYDLVRRIRGKKSHYEYLLAFSWITNGRKLISVEDEEKCIVFLKGIRSLSIIWIVACSHYSFALVQTLQSSMEIKSFSREIWNMALIHGSYAVDIFLILSGLLTVYNFFHRRERGEKFNLGYYYVHRYLRLTPAFTVIVIVQKNLLQYLGPGPTWYIARETLIEPCRDGWWSNLLYLENILNKGNCVPQAWYLQVVVQLYFFSPIILLFFAKWMKIGVAFVVLLLIASVATNISLSYIYEINEFPFAKADMEIFYHQTYVYFGSYIIGMILGYLILNIKKKSPTLSNLLVTFLWTISIAGILNIIFDGFILLENAEYKKIENVLYISIGHLLWSFSIATMIFLCASGYGGWFQRFLSMQIFDFIAKLSYSIFLVHVAVIVLRYTTTKTPFHFTSWNMFFSFWGDLVVTIFVAAVLHITVEQPLKFLEDYFLIGNVSKKRSAKSTKNDVDNKITRNSISTSLHKTVQTINNLA